KRSGGDRFNIMMSDEIPNEQSPVIPLTFDYRGEQDGREQTFTVTNDDNAKYLFVQTNLNEREVPLLQIESGGSSTEYMPRYYLPKQYLDPKLETENINKRDFNFNFYANFH